jgi:hypothetical protein
MAVWGVMDYDDVVVVVVVVVGKACIMSYVWTFTWHLKSFYSLK